MVQLFFKINNKENIMYKTLKKIIIIINNIGKEEKKIVIY